MNAWALLWAFLMLSISGIGLSGFITVCSMVRLEYRLGTLSWSEGWEFIMIGSAITLFLLCFGIAELLQRWPDGGRINYPSSE